MTILKDWGGDVKDSGSHPATCLGDPDRLWRLVFHWMPDRLVYGAHGGISSLSHIHCGCLGSARALLRGMGSTGLWVSEASPQTDEVGGTRQIRNPNLGIRNESRNDSFETATRNGRGGERSRSGVPASQAPALIGSVGADRTAA